ncbi:Ig-like domain-containing protein [Microvenator marinus]|nr:Ig-like domain-containing protein [Microvenator marinus]
MGCTGSEGAGFSAWRKTLSLLAFLGLAAASSSAQAQTFDIDTSAGAAVYDQTEAPVFVDDGLVITGTLNLDGARVAITTGFDALGDRLSFTSQHGITGAYDNTTGILTLSGTATPTQYQDVLRTVRYESVTTGNPPPGARTIQYSLGASIFFEPNGHFYEFVSAPGIDWADARNAAAARSYFGLQGYLVTVTSAAENSFVSGKLSGQGWMGASDQASESIWRWVTGPEGLESSGQGRHFFTQVGNGGSAVNGEYHNWASGEPNDAGGEDHAHFLINGQWNDYRFDNNAIAGYVVEYGGMPSDPSLDIVATRELDVLTCFDGTFNGVETDVDCGDVCGPCGDLDNCADDSDCTSGVCDGGVCQAPTCTDSVQNGTETGTDCGGSCAGCGTGVSCNGPNDCESLNCQSGVCQAPTCSDNILNGDETGTDCGGSCGACGVNGGCNDGTDCTTGVCSGGVCQAATCSDNTQNQDETGVDCGGATCGPCGSGEGCLGNNDCSSGVCTGNVCQAPSCSDNTQNQDETGVDCGGATCGPCADGGGCSDDTDCSSGVCNGNVCQVPTCTDGTQNQDETGADCGGATCGPCADGGGCSDGGDCTSGVCDGNVCQVPTCTDGTLNQDETDVDCGGATCGPCADGGACNQPTECSSGVCTANVCQVPTCTDGVMNGDETDMDCGGSCGPCADNGGCLADGDCTSGVCDAGVCQVPTCTDNTQNQDETGVDCGGATCGPCADGGGCSGNSDCTSGVCDAGVCQVPTCSDNTLNQDETDVDCGGATCGPCADGGACNQPSECASGVCTGNLCQAPTCSDGVENGDETDVDCGGSCGPCADGGSCGAPSDCTSGVCDSGQCAVPTCTDNTQNGDETDVDCGGSCGPCADGGSCSVPGDCTSGVCDNGTCETAQCNDGVQNGTESDVDCGGSCGPCADGGSCASAGDCSSGVCDSGQCAIPTCTDGVQNAGETDVDCGGGTCGACGDGSACSVAGDCSTNLCSAGVCVVTIDSLGEITSPAEDELLSTATPTISGTSEAGTTIEIFVDGVLVASPVADSNGDWTYTPEDDLDDGARVIEAVFTDGIGNQTTSEVNVVVDTTAPQVTVTSPANGELLSVTPDRITGESEPGNEINVYINSEFAGTATADENGVWELEIDPLDIGDYRIRVTSRDEADNIGETESDFSIVDGVRIATPEDGQLIRIARPSFSGVSTPNTDVQLFLNDTPVATVTADDDGNWTYTPDSDLADGEFELRAEGAGDSTDSVSFTVDTTRTGLVIDEPAEGALVNQNTVTFRGTALADSTVTVTVDGAEVGQVTADENGAWEWESPELEDGEFSAEFTSENEIGEPETASRTITVDTTAPSLEVTSPLAGESFPEDGVITGQAEPGATVEVFVDDTLVGETTADENGDWALELPEDFDAAAGGDLRVTATDEAGNTTTVELSVPEEVVETVDARILEGGCEGCAAASNSTEGSFWLLAFGLFLLGRRRRVRAR